MQNNDKNAPLLTDSFVDKDSHFITSQEIQQWLIERLSILLKTSQKEINIREPFLNYGLGSREALSLSGELEQWLKRKLSPTLLWDYPTIENLSYNLANEKVKEFEVLSNKKNNYEPIAIVGMGCRFPGAKNIKDYWELLQNGINAIKEIPSNRWKIDKFYDPDPNSPGKMNTRWGGFLEDIDLFDYSYFSISLREAANMDPQQRLLLEVAIEALEDAGQDLESLTGSQTGVFIGISSNDYARTQLSDPTLINVYAATGNAMSIAANRISYFLDLHGPSISIDTACSSSLVAVSLACQNIWEGKTPLAIAGGVNLILSPDITINFSKAGVMSPDGQCKAFDSKANGFVRGEGVGVIILKPLSKAILDNDLIYAVILGASINQDGRSNGLMAPNRQAQELVLKQAYQSANILPGQVQYIETHGTGTFLGDQIEAKALGSVLANNRPPNQLCLIGSVKTNIGHLESAAGIAGLIKTSLSLKHKKIPPSLNFETPNPHIPFHDLLLKVQTELIDWPKEENLAIAGISSFGFGGTNCHVVLQESPILPRNESFTSNQTQILTISAHNPKAVKDLARQYKNMLTHTSDSIYDICYSSAVRRSHRSHRVVVVGTSIEAIRAELEIFLKGENSDFVFSGVENLNLKYKLVFVFSGQGSQWIGMGKQLLKQEAVFRSLIERCDKEISKYFAWSLLTQLNEPQAKLEDIEIIQPTIFSIQIALAGLWHSWGITPSAIVGHSMGEVAAAYVAGALSFADAVKVICLRSKLLKQASGKGSMASVELSHTQATKAIESYKGKLYISSSNSIKSTVIGGDTDALKELIESLQNQDIYCRFIKVDVASHTPQMDPLRTHLVEELKTIRPRPATIPIYSSVTGKLSYTTKFNAEYWGRNLREPVLFSDAINCLAQDNYNIFIEISPHAILLSSIQQNFQHLSKEVYLFSSMRREENESITMLSTLAKFYTIGYPIDWKKLYPTGKLVKLPLYPWQNERCWLETKKTKYLERQFFQQTSSYHPLLGQRLKSSQPFWENTLNNISYLSDHCIEGEVVLPAAAYIEMCLKAASQIASDFKLTEITLHKTLLLSLEANILLETICSSNANGEKTFQIFSCNTKENDEKEEWILHLSCKVSSKNLTTKKSLAQIKKEEILEQCQLNISGKEYYEKLQNYGLDYGLSFQAINQIWKGKSQAFVEIDLPSNLDSTSYIFHPSLLDACFQSLGATIIDQEINNNTKAFVPISVKEIKLLGEIGRKLWAHLT
ncbi:MAG: acyltransferase domain-containing protein [Blastocatellia bacterium]|nr:acyltransferase domain-containing protein [Blastocatellia bacterium]